MAFDYRLKFELSIGYQPCCMRPVNIVFAT